MLLQPSDLVGCRYRLPQKQQFTNIGGFFWYLSLYAKPKAAFYTLGSIQREVEKQKKGIFCFGVDRFEHQGDERDVGSRRRYRTVQEPL